MWRQETPPHMFSSRVARPPPSLQPCLSVLNQLQQPPASNSAEERYHPLFRALKRLQGPALLTTGDIVPVPASPVCPSPHGLLPWQRQPNSLPAGPLGAGGPATECQGSTGAWAVGAEPLERIPFVAVLSGTRTTAEWDPTGVQGQTCPAEGQCLWAWPWYVPIVPELWVQSGPHGPGCDVTGERGGGHPKISVPADIGTAGCRDPPPSEG